MNESETVSKLVKIWATLDETIKWLRTTPHSLETARYVANELEKVRNSEILFLPEHKDTADIPVYEIDPRKKYVLSIYGNITELQRERLRADIRLWVYDTNMPFLVVNGNAAKLVKVEDAEDK